MIVCFHTTLSNLSILDILHKDHTARDRVTVRSPHAILRCLLLTGQEIHWSCDQQTSRKMRYWEMKHKSNITWRWPLPKVYLGEVFLNVPCVHLTKSLLTNMSAWRKTTKNLMRWYAWIRRSIIAIPLFSPSLPPKRAECGTRRSSKNNSEVSCAFMPTCPNEIGQIRHSTHHFRRCYDRN